ncbi:hypothetical protein N0V94_004112 [Neodidymelliopsis sp. IMI 364377]|nr:hypothetical protein N0V94_004112 [Neodidymelliopsis sp. IMI 364377]
MITLSSSAIRTPVENWPNFEERIWNAKSKGKGAFRKWDGTFIAPISEGDSTAKVTQINRGKFHMLLRQYAAEAGLPVEYSTKVQQFFEVGNEGGIILADGRKFTADLVVAADGVGSKSWNLFAGTNTSPVSSGFVLYRITYPTAEAFKSPIVAKELEGYDSRGFFYAGPDTHFMASMNGDEICWMLTCRDNDSNAEESWSKPNTTKNALEVVKDWDPLVPELIMTVPNGSIFDWKMMWRDPQPQWVSKGSRIIQLGDAAHPFLPTSASGATMALEDAWSLAACLNIGGKNNVPLAIAVHNKLRFERVSCAQKLGLKNREVLHKTDWDYVAKHPEVLSVLFFKKWINYHDAAKYAAENYESCAKHLVEGAPFENTNSVPGYKYKPWTVQELLKASREGEQVEDEGDWS